MHKQTIELTIFFNIITNFLNAFYDHLKMNSDRTNVYYDFIFDISHFSIFSCISRSVIKYSTFDQMTLKLKKV